MEEISVPPRCEHGERMMTGIASITLDVESGNSVSLVQHFAVDLSVDLSDCVNDVQINSLLYCSDQDEIHATVWKYFIRVDVPLVRSSCSSVGATSFALTGSCLESIACLGKSFFQEWSRSCGRVEWLCVIGPRF